MAACTQPTKVLPDWSAFCSVLPVTHVSSCTHVSITIAVSLPSTIIDVSQTCAGGRIGRGGMGQQVFSCTSSLQTIDTYQNDLLQTINNHLERLSEEQQEEV